MFYVPSHLGERLMLPTKYLEDLKTSPVDKVDFVATFFEVRDATSVHVYMLTCCRCSRVGTPQWVVVLHYIRE